MLPLILSLLSPLLLLLLLPRPVTPLAYTVTGTKNGLPIDASAIELVAFPSERSGGLAALDLLTLTRRTQAPAAAPSPGAAVLDNNAWCGPVLTTPATNAVTAVHAYFQVPTPTLRPGVAAPQYVGEWVGIDGMSYSAALLQAGAAQAVGVFLFLFFLTFFFFPFLFFFPFCFGVGDVLIRDLQHRSTPTVPLPTGCGGSGTRRALLLCPPFPVRCLTLPLRPCCFSFAHSFLLPCPYLK